MKDNENSGGLKLTLEVGRPGLVILWAIFIFATGVITGGALLHIMRPRPPRHERMETPLPRDYSRRMQRDLQLSDEQAGAVEEIVARYEPLFQHTSEQAKEKLKEDLEMMNQELLPLLDDRQREIHMEEWRKMLRPPRERRPPLPRRDGERPRHPDGRRPVPPR